MLDALLQFCNSLTGWGWFVLVTLTWCAYFLIDAVMVHAQNGIMRAILSWRKGRTTD